MANKKLNQSITTLKGEVVEVDEEGLIKVQIIKPNSIEEDEENLLELGQTLVDFCKLYENTNKTIELKCDIKVVD